MPYRDLKLTAAAAARARRAYTHLLRRVGAWQALVMCVHIWYVMISLYNKCGHSVRSRRYIIERTRIVEPVNLRTPVLTVVQYVHVDQMLDSGSVKFVPFSVYSGRGLV